MSEEHEILQKTLNEVTHKKQAEQEILSKEINQMIVVDKE